jgi:hypothetical protein
MSSSKKHTCANHNKREILESIDALIYCNIPDRYREPVAEEYEFKEWVDKKGQPQVKIVGWDCPIQKLTLIRNIIEDLCKNINEKIDVNKKLVEANEELLEDNVKFIEDNKKGILNMLEDNVKLMKENEYFKSNCIDYNKLSIELEKTHYGKEYEKRDDDDFTFTEYILFLEAKNEKLTDSFAELWHKYENKHDILLTHFNEYLEVNNLTTDFSQFLIANKYDN